MNALSAFLQLLLRLLKRAVRKAREQEAKDAQKERNQIEENPSSWLDKHFNGVPDDSTMPSDAKDADKTDSSKPRQD